MFDAWILLRCFKNNVFSSIYFFTSPFWLDHIHYTFGSTPLGWLVKSQFFLVVHIFCAALG